MGRKIVQTAGRDQLGDFAPMFAHLNDGVLFGEVWNDETISVKLKCILSFQWHNRFFIAVSFGKCEKEWSYERRICKHYDTYQYVYWMAPDLGSVPLGKGCLE